MGKILNVEDSDSDTPTPTSDHGGGGGGGGGVVGGGGGARPHWGSGGGAGFMSGSDGPLSTFSGYPTAPSSVPPGYGCTMEVQPTAQNLHHISNTQSKLASFVSQEPVGKDSELLEFPLDDSNEFY